MKFRKEKDFMGEVSVPAGMFFGASTQRAVENFPISGLRFPQSFIRSFSELKKACSEVNAELGLLDTKVSRAISKCCDLISRGDLNDQFVVDVFQTGSGTSTNMNFNEVIAYVASKELKIKVHPNDHVNLGQSSNDVFPTSIHLASSMEIHQKLIPALEGVEKELQKKCREFRGIVKVGRTHLQDATPLTLEQEFSGYLEQIKKSRERVLRALPSLLELAIGGTAVGTGVNTHPDFGKKVIQKLKQKSKLNFQQARNHFEAQASKDGCLEASAALRSVAVSLTKISNDIRWLSCGPRAGIGELVIPAIQPGSSIMPGKVNPVIPEAVLQVGAKVIGNDSSITWAVASGNFELNTMMPLIAYCLLESIEILSNALLVFQKKCLEGMRANSERIKSLLENNLMLATPLALVVGYDQAAEVAKKAWEQNRSVREVALEMLSLSVEELDHLLDPKNMIKPQK